MAGSARRLLLHAHRQGLPARRLARLVLHAAARRRGGADRVGNPGSAPAPDRSVIILGLNAFHGDSSAVLLRDGMLVAAAEEERFRRVKHWAGFPSQAIAYCLREAGVSLADVEHVAVNQDSR